MKWLLFGTMFVCGYLIGIEAGKKIFEEGLRLKAEELFKNLRVVPLGDMMKNGKPSTFEDILEGIAKKSTDPGVS